MARLATARLDILGLAGCLTLPAGSAPASRALPSATLVLVNEGLGTSLRLGLEAASGGGRRTPTSSVWSWKLSTPLGGSHSGRGWRRLRHMSFSPRKRGLRKPTYLRPRPGRAAMAGAPYGRLPGSRPRRVSHRELPSSPGTLWGCTTCQAAHTRCILRAPSWEGWKPLANGRCAFSRATLGMAPMVTRSTPRSSRMCGARCKIAARTRCAS